SRAARGSADQERFRREAASYFGIILEIMGRRRGRRFIKNRGTGSVPSGRHRGHTSMKNWRDRLCPVPLSFGRHGPRPSNENERNWPQTSAAFSANRASQHGHYH